MEGFLLNKNSVQSTPNCFVLASTETKLGLLIKAIKERYFPVGSMQIHSVKGEELHAYCFLLQTGLRISTIQTLCKKHCVVSPFAVRGVKKACVSKLIRWFQLNPDFQCIECEFAPDCKETEEKLFDHQMLNEFAVQKNITDTLFLLALYKRFETNPEKCKLCQQEAASSLRSVFKTHRRDHRKHFENAQLFVKLRDLKKCCQYAVDQVLAEKRYKALTETRDERVEARVEVLLKNIADIIKSPEATDSFICAVIILQHLLPECIEKICETFILNPPKRRYYIFKGPINTGKTTVAAAILDFFTGASLNLNGNPDRLQFELGCAIDAFMVLIEDIKGAPVDPKSSLPRGLGMINLDNMRDFLEGSVCVNLERKHQNKVAQIFPPGIITMNNYVIPPTVRVRCVEIIDFKKLPFVHLALENNPRVRQERWLIKGETLAAALFLFHPTMFTQKIKEKMATEIALLNIECDKRFAEYSVAIKEGKACI